MKPYVLFLLLAISVEATSQQSADPAGIRVEIYNNDYPYSDLGFYHSIANLSMLVGLPVSNTPSFGVHRLDISKGRYFYRDTTAEGLLGGSFSGGQASNFQYHNSGAHTVFSYSESGIWSLNVLGQTLDWQYDLSGPNFDTHGVAVLPDQRVVYAEVVFDTLSFYNPPFILDESEWPVAAQNIVLFDPADQSHEVLFNWFETVPETFIISQYAHEGNLGSQVIDWPHFNWVDVDFDGHYLISWRHLGVCKIHSSSGEIIWWAGIPENMAADHGFPELTCITGDCRMRLQHNIRPLDGHPGYYTVFDNGDAARDSSRALFLHIDKDAGTIAVDKDFWFDFSPFSGSLNVRPDGSFLVNVPKLGGLRISQLQEWAIEGVLADSAGIYLPDMGSYLYLCDASGEVLAHYRTDSMNFIYQAQFAELDDWPEVACAEDTFFIEGLNQEDVESVDWYLDDELYVDQPAIPATNDLRQATFDYGIAVGYADPVGISGCAVTGSPSGELRSLNLFPNPCSAEGFRISNYSGPIRVVDPLGRLVWSAAAISGELAAPGLESGLYIVSGEGWSRKLMVR